MNEPLVSIIFPTWNRAHMLKTAIAKILLQSYKNFELIIVDDGSTDNTEEVVKSIIAEKKDPRINYIRMEHQGGAFARNKALRQAHGEFIASQDDDDEWDPQYIEAQVKKLSSSPIEYGMSYVAYWRVLANGKKILMPPKSALPREGNIYGGDIMRKNYCPFQAGMIRRSVLDDVGLVCEKINSLYDWEMWLRIAKKYKIAHIDKPLFVLNDTPNSNSNNPKTIWWRIDARKYIIREYGNDIKKFGYFHAHISTLTDLLIQAGDIKQARRYLREGIFAKPFSITLWLKLLTSFLGAISYKKIQSIYRGE
ncbi:MAG: glycosyltransferase family 2 protein [Patescibacteria group bacterium]